MSPARLHALVDGVFAIAITLLALDLPRPVKSADLMGDLGSEWPRYIAFVVSFATIGVVWLEHLALSSATRTVNRRFLELNLVVLLFVSIIPWPTALAAEFVGHGGPNASAATTSSIPPQSPAFRLRADAPCSDRSPTCPRSSWRSSLRCGP